MNDSAILQRLEYIIQAYKSGLLGGEKMPEHENPGLPPDSKENYMYFTLPMALNYQRNSYKLWECANKLYAEKPCMFDSRAVCETSPDTIKSILTEYKVALQPNNQPVIWTTLCKTVESDFKGDIRRLFSEHNYEVAAIKSYIESNRKKFPYLGGSKICNYWLYVMEQYTDAHFADRENITVAPDTHVIQSSLKLGVITEEEAQSPNVREITAERWNMLLSRSGIAPIDIHTPLWLWSRGGFSVTL